MLTPRLSAELSVDYSLARLQITQANSDSIEATRASFISAFNGLITSNPSRVLNSLTSTAALESGGAHQLFTSGALIINLRTTGRVIPYATVGASLISTTGKMPSATLKGNYQFLNPSGSPINETDNVTVRDARDDRTVAGILGGGVKYHVSPRWGIRLDARVSLSKNTASTVLDATPNVALGQLPAGRARFERGSDDSVQQQLVRPRDGARCDSSRCLDSDRPRNDRPSHLVRERCIESHEHHCRDILAILTATEERGCSGGGKRPGTVSASASPLIPAVRARER